MTLNSDCICRILWFYTHFYIEMWSRSLPFLNSDRRRKRQRAFINTLFALCSNKDTIEYTYMMDMRMRSYLLTHRRTQKVAVNAFLCENVRLMLTPDNGILSYSEFEYDHSLRYSILFNNRSIASLRHIIVQFESGLIQLWNVGFLNNLLNKLQYSHAAYIIICPVFKTCKSFDTGKLHQCS